MGLLACGAGLRLSPTCHDSPALHGTLTFTKVPSGLNTWMRSLGRSQTYKRPSCDSSAQSHRIPELLRRRVVRIVAPQIHIIRFLSVRAPVPDQIALLIELQNGRSGEAAFRRPRILSRVDFLGVERAGAMDDPDMVVGIDRYADRLAQQPVVGQRLGPHRVHFKSRRLISTRCMNLQPSGTYSESNEFSGVPWHTHLPWGGRMVRLPSLTWADALVRAGPPGPATSPPYASPPPHPLSRTSAAPH
jgi:hypothetical protein